MFIKKKIKSTYSSTYLCRKSVIAGLQLLSLQRCYRIKKVCWKKNRWQLKNFAGVNSVALRLSTKSQYCPCLATLQSPVRLELPFILWSVAIVWWPFVLCRSFVMFQKNKKFFFVYSQTSEWNISVVELNVVIKKIVINSFEKTLLLRSKTIFFVKKINIATNRCCLTKITKFLDSANGPLYYAFYHTRK